MHFYRMFVFKLDLMTLFAKPYITKMCHYYFLNIIIIISVTIIR